MKKTIVTLLVLVTLLGTVFAQGGSEASAAKTVKLTLSEVHAEGYPTTLADYEFSRLVSEKTNGRIQIEVYSGGTLYGQETGAIEALQIGDLAFSRVSASPVASYVPKINALQMPYLYRDGAHMWKVLDGEIGQGLLADIQTSGSGLVGLAYYDAGSRNFYTKKPVHTVADMAGLKIRMQNNQMMVRMVELLGANGVTGIGPNDVYSAITQGTIDGAENNWPTYESMGDYEAAPYFLLDGHTRVPEILLASEAVLKTLDPADVEIIKQCAKETQAYEIQKWAEREESSRAKVLAGGATATQPTAALLAEFQSRMAPLYQEYGKDYMDIITAIQNVK
jgi:tripartite ATP-independent transporter DctP family solute receptor